MQGKRCERVWGWDCHGLPIEEKVQKKLGLTSNKDIEEVGIKKFIEECYTYTRETSAEWDWYIEHIGRWVDMENCYKTMDQDYMESVMWVFKSMWDKGMVYKGQRVSLYSWKLSTPISNFEVAMDDSYETVSDPAITVMFPLSENKTTSPHLNSSPKGERQGVRAGDFILAWTTTPWTIPAHMSMALNANLAYSRVKSGDEYFILATARVETVFKGREYEIVESFM
jgi:isoleucyl-tRNA synthetase